MNVGKMSFVTYGDGVFLFGSARLSSSFAKLNRPLAQWNIQDFD